MNKLIIFSICAVIAFFFFKKDDNMPQQQLTVYGQDEYGSIDGMIGGKCLEEKCLTIYVAPWCPQLQHAWLPMLLKARPKTHAYATTLGGQS